MSSTVQSSTGLLSIPLYKREFIALMTSEWMKKVKTLCVVCPMNGFEQRMFMDAPLDSPQGGELEVLEWLAQANEIMRLADSSGQEPSEVASMFLQQVLTALQASAKLEKLWLSFEVVQWGSDRTELRRGICRAVPHSVKEICIYRQTFPYGTDPAKHGHRPDVITHEFVMGVTAFARMLMEVDESEVPQEDLQGDADGEHENEDEDEDEDKAFMNIVEANTPRFSFMPNLECLSVQRLAKKVDWGARHMERRQLIDEAVAALRTMMDMRPQLNAESFVALLLTWRP